MILEQSQTIHRLLQTAVILMLLKVTKETDINAGLSKMLLFV